MISKQQTIHLGTDHAGFELKNQIKDYLQDSGYLVVDHGADIYNDQDDYPDYIIPAVESAVADKGLAIVFGGSGQGEAMAANKVSGAMATVYYGGPSEILKLSKTHNNANVLSIGARFVSFDDTIKAIDLWLSLEFSNKEKYQRRINRVSIYERK